MFSGPCEPPVSWGVCISLLQHRPSVHTGLTAAVCLCLCHSFCVFRMDAGVSTEPICAADPSQGTLCKWNLPRSGERVPPALRTHPNQYSSCKTYFTKMALFAAGQKRERRALYPPPSVTGVMWGNLKDSSIGEGCAGTCSTCSSVSLEQYDSDAVDKQSVERYLWIQPLINKLRITAAFLSGHWVYESHLPPTGWASPCRQARVPTLRNLGRSWTVKWSARFAGHVCQCRPTSGDLVLSSIPSATHTHTHTKECAHALAHKPRLAYCTIRP